MPSDRIVPALTRTDRHDDDMGAPAIHVLPSHLPITEESRPKQSKPIYYFSNFQHLTTRVHARCMS